MNMLDDYVHYNYCMKCPSISFYVHFHWVIVCNDTYFSETFLVAAIAVGEGYHEIPPPTISCSAT